MPGAASHTLIDQKFDLFNVTSLLSDSTILLLSAASVSPLYVEPHFQIFSTLRKYHDLRYET